MSQLELEFDCGESSLHVRHFTVTEGISIPFTATVWAHSLNPAVPIREIIGRPASLRVVSGYKFVRLGGARLWTGVCNYVEQVKAEPAGLSTYYLRIVPKLWLLSQRRGYRIFQHLSIPDIIDKLLAEWSIEPVWKIDRGNYPKLEYKVQYDENDYAFFCRLLEEVGIAFTFPDDDEKGSLLVLGDALHKGEPRPGDALHFVDNPNQEAELEFVTHVTLSHEVRPGAHTIRDYDFRNPAFPLFGEAPKAAMPEDRLEQYHYQPGSFLVETGKGGDTPVADDKGIARYDQRSGTERAERALLGARQGKIGVSFDTNTTDLWPGMIFSIDNHPHAELDAGKQLMVTEFTLEGSPSGEWQMSGRAVFTDAPYRPALSTPKPRVLGMQSATVVGPKGQEIHTDEFGRVRVQFPWDREGQSDDNSSCWIRVNQGWGGAGYGWLMLPRIGQEVLIAFLDGDPDQPVLVGRVYNQTNPVPYKLPENKTISTWKSDSSQGGGGFNEIKFEDKKGDELVYVQAEKKLRKLVKNDETITVLRDRQKLVVLNETDTTGANRTEVTGINRFEVTAMNRAIVIGANRAKLVKLDEQVRTHGYRRVRVGQDADTVVKGDKRERVEDDVHLYVKGKRSQKIDGTQSLTIVESQYEFVEGSHALAAGKEIHLQSNELFVGEGMDVTAKGPGGFLRIDASGVTISGTTVKINAGGSAGHGHGSHPEEPDPAIEAVVGVPDTPFPDELVPPPPEEWIDIVLKDDGESPKPVPFQKFRIEFPDGSVRDGFSDATGKARVLGPPGENYKISFPDLDGKSWK